MKAGREGRWLVGEELEKGIALQQHAAGMHRAHSAALLLLVLRVCCACSAACELTGCSISLLPSPSLTVPYGLADTSASGAGNSFKQNPFSLQAPNQRCAGHEVFSHWHALRKPSSAVVRSTVLAFQPMNDLLPAECFVVLEWFYCPLLAASVQPEGLHAMSGQPCFVTWPPHSLKHRSGCCPAGLSARPTAEPSAAGLVTVISSVLLRTVFVRSCPCCCAFLAPRGGVPSSEGWRCGSGFVLCFPLKRGFGRSSPAEQLMGVVRSVGLVHDLWVQGVAGSDGAGQGKPCCCWSTRGPPGGASCWELSVAQRVGSCSPAATEALMLCVVQQPSPVTACSHLLHQER